MRKGRKRFLEPTEDRRLPWQLRGGVGWGRRGGVKTRLGLVAAVESGAFQGDTMRHAKKWLEGESWSDHLSLKILLTLLCAVVGGLGALRLLGVW